MARKAELAHPSGRAEVARMRLGLGELFGRVNSVEPGNEVVGDLNAFICIRISGFLEQSIVTLCRKTCEGIDGHLVRSFALSWLTRSRNPNSNWLRELIERFSNDWAADLQDFLAHEERGNRLNALVKLRNDLAHGTSRDVSAKDAMDYLALADEIVEWLSVRFDPL